LSGLCGATRRTQDVVLAIPPGDEAAQLEWIAAQLREWSQAGRFERVLIEVGGTSNAARLAHNFGLLPGEGSSFASWAELHQIVCVVDALDLTRTSLNKSQNVLFDFQRGQIKGATLIVLNKCDLVKDEEREACTRLVRSINSHAKIIETDYGEIPPEVWLRPATARELELVFHPSEPEETSLTDSSLVMPTMACALYRAYHPFHPERFWNWFHADHSGLLRMKGLIWLATRNLLVGGVSRTSWENACGPAGIWWAALPREDWPEEPEALMRMQETWREPYGDRRQELVLIGHEAQLASLTRQLDACLLNAAEFARPVKEWTTFPDPFPEWDLNGSD